MTDKSVSSHYDASAASYSLQYQKELLSDLSRDYPANYFRLQLVLNSCLEKKVKRVIEVGVGEGTPLVTLAKEGMEVSGFDISEEMVKTAKKTFSANALNPDNILLGDIQDPSSYASLLRDGPYDALLAMGVMPHIRDDAESLANMKALVKPGGSVFIEFRNKLFSLFTFNRYTYEFILDDLLAGVSPQMKDLVGADLKKRLEMEKPTPRVHHDENSDAPGYDAILSKFHNPFEMAEVFKASGFRDVNFLWYHYHPAMPYLREASEALFREEALKLEQDTTGWRGFFLCSAFVISAVKE